MATYYGGNTDGHLHSSGDGSQTLVLISPSYIGIDTQQTTRQESPTTNNLVYLPHAPPHFVGIPLSVSSTATSSQDQDAVGFVPSRAHYDLYNHSMDGGATAPPEHPRRQQGLSLSLSSTRVAGASPPPRADEMMGLSSNGVVQNQVLLGSKYLRAAQGLLDEVVNVGKGLEGLPEKGKCSGGGEPSVAQSATGGGGEGGSKRGASELSTAERQEIQMKKAKLVNMLDQVEQKYRQYHHQMHMVISWFEQVAGLGSSAKSYTALALRTISKQFRCLKDAILNQIKAATKSLGEEEEPDNKIKGSRLKYVDNQIRQQRALQQLGMVQHNAWRPQRGLPERAVSVLRAWLFEHFLHPYPKDSDKITLAKQTGLTRSQVSNWFINARVRLWKPMVEEMYMEEMKEKGSNIVSSSSPLSSDHKAKTSKSEHKEDSSSKPFTSHQIPTNLLENYQPQNSTTFTARNQEDPINHNTMNVDENPGFNLIVPSETDHSITQGNSKSSNIPTPKNLRMSPSDHQHHQFLRNSSPNISLITSMNVDSKQPTTEGIAHGFTMMGGFGSYPIAELAGRFGPEASFNQSCNYYSGNSVSLTLGLQHSENNHNLAITAAQHQCFMPNSHQGVHEISETNDFTGMNNEAAATNNAHSTGVCESINIEDRKRFVVQLLPDFVA